MLKSEEWAWLRDMFTYHIDDVEPLTSKQKSPKKNSKKKRVGHGS